MSQTNKDTIDNVENYPLDFSRMLYMQYQEMDFSIRHADTKAQLIVGINAILITGLTGSSSVTIPDPLTATGGTLPPELSLLLRAAVLFWLVLSIFFSLSTIMPRYKPSDVEHNLFFFGDIKRMEEAPFIEQYMGMSLDEVKTRILAQLHAKSFIIAAKFQRVRLSLVCLLLALVFWIVHFITQMV